MQSELKPCPFCGSDRLMVLPPTCNRDTSYSAADRAYPVVRCSGCYTDVPGKDFDASSKSAVEAWNRRSALVDVPAVEPVAYLRLESRTDIDGEKYTGLQISDLTDERAFPVYTSPPLSREGEDSAEVIEELLRHLDRMQSNAIRAGELAWHPNSPIAESIEKVRVLAADVSSGGDHG